MIGFIKAGRMEVVRLQAHFEEIGQPGESSKAIGLSLSTIHKRGRKIKDIITLSSNKHNNRSTPQYNGKYS